MGRCRPLGCGSHWLLNRLFCMIIDPQKDEDISMAGKALRTAGKKKQPAAVETSSSLEAKINAFLESGGKIEKIQSGVSGQPSMGSAKPKAAATRS